MEQVFEYIAIIGTIAFSISGALTAMNKKFDTFGIFIIAFATAVGGGSLRDVLVSNQSVFWLIHPQYIYYILIGTVTAVIFRRYLGYLRKTLLIFDTLGLAFYTIIGVEVGIQNGLSGISSVALGVITGVFGGIIRDILVNDIPVIFQKEVYAIVSILGASVYYLIHQFLGNNPYLQLIPISLIILLRLLAVAYKVSLPLIHYDKPLIKRPGMDNDVVPIQNIHDKSGNEKLAG